MSDLQRPESLAFHAIGDPSGVALRMLRDALPILNRYRALATARAAELLRREGIREVSEVATPADLPGSGPLNRPVACFLLGSGAGEGAAEAEDLVRACLREDVAIAVNEASARLLLQGLRGERRATLIFNPVAGAGDPGADLTRIRKLLEPAFHLTIRETARDVAASTLAAAALDEGAEVVLAAGGDGTVAEAAAALRGSEAVLGIIPRGTANALAVTLFGPALRLDPIGFACRAIVAGTTRTIDTATCNGRLMLQLAGIGVEAGMIRRATRELKGRFGVLAYLAGGWRQIRAQEAFEVRVECDGRAHRFQTGSLVVANAAPPSSVFAQGNGSPIVDDGLLDVTTIVDVSSTWEAIDTVLRLMNAGLIHTPAGDRVMHMRGRSIRVDATPPQNLVIDGEIAGTTPVEFEVVPQSLKVFAPPARLRSTGDDEVDGG
jgi:diacylglycerol kinase family enzyme